MNLIFCKLKRGKMYLFGLVRFGIGRKIEKHFFAFSVSELKKDLVIYYILPCKC